MARPAFNVGRSSVRLTVEPSRLLDVPNFAFRDSSAVLVAAEARVAVPSSSMRRAKLDVPGESAASAA
jgi:hypothetical protein